jgi:predicted acyl esterase
MVKGISAEERISAPGRYQGFSGPEYRGVVKRSVYVTMRDGVKLAVEYRLPRGLGPSEKIPAVIEQTRYWRSMVFNVKDDGTGDYLVRHGYAFVSVDVRGTGASSGVWRYPWSEEEIKDGAEVVDWVVSQPWCNGVVGTFGISYTGSTAEFLLTNKHPAVKAAVIRFSLFDSYTDIAYPGGILHKWFMETWSHLNRALDSNDTGGLLEMMGVPFNIPGIPGVKPVGGFFKGRAELRKALEGHADNGDVYAESLKVEFRDDYSENWEGTIKEISPYFYARDIEASGAAVYSYTGWFDGLYTASAVNRYLNLSNCEKLTIGPWPHGGEENISPWRESREVEFDHQAELLRFLDYHLKGIDNGIMAEPPVWYYTFGEEKWKSADTWPPESETVTYYFSEKNALTRERPVESAAADIYRADYEARTGRSSRYESLFYSLWHRPIRYPHRAEADKRLLVYETAPLASDMEVTGHPVVRLYVSSTTDDGRFFAYLEDVAPDGRVSYITEGMLRAACRAMSDEAPPYKTAPGVPYHTFRREDARPLFPGEVALITFDLQPTSVLFKKGHRIRIAIACADRDHFAVPEGPAPELKFFRSAEYPSAVDLPVIL